MVPLVKVAASVYNSAAPSAGWHIYDCGSHGGAANGPPLAVGTRWSFINSARPADRPQPRRHGPSRANGRATSSGGRQISGGGVWLPRQWPEADSASGVCPGRLPALQRGLRAGKNRAAARGHMSALRLPRSPLTRSAPAPVLHGVQF